MPKTALRKSNIRPGPALDLPPGTDDELEPKFLLLDPQNLRLLERVDSSLHDVPVRLIGQKSIQEELTKTLYSDPLFDIKPLETSILYNGFLKHERLIIASYDGDSFLVLEGNRRLTAVRHIYETYGTKLTGLRADVRQSLQTLPCFIIKGLAIGSSAERLAEYRRAAEIYIGMRHLMGARRWEPASRYEFQARLILEEGWSVADVAERFGRDKSEVLRDLKAQRLYQDFRRFEGRNKIGHSLTYNAFAEAARAPSIMKWFGWSNEQLAIKHKDREQAFFHYLLSRLSARGRVNRLEGEEETGDESAEAIVRRLRDMLKLGDDTVESALVDRDFNSADLFFEERREGAFAKRVTTYIRGLRRATGEELRQNPRENKSKLKELIEQAKQTIVIVDAILKS